jgi:flagellar motility protein MotE (MotC chaperone)
VSTVQTKKGIDTKNPVDKSKQDKTEIPQSVQQRSFWSIWLVLVVIMVMAGGVILGGYLAGWINPREQLSKLPGIEKIFGLNSESPNPVVIGMGVLEKENLELKRKINEQQDLIEGILAEKQALEQNKVALEQNKQVLEQRLQVLENKLEPKTGNSQNEMVDYRKLAVYYSDMKPAAVVAILNKLDDEMVLGIFQEMESDKIAKILTIMLPDRAALLSTMIKTNNTD